MLLFLFVNEILNENFEFLFQRVLLFERVTPPYAGLGCVPAKFDRLPTLAPRDRAVLREKLMKKHCRESSPHRIAVETDHEHERRRIVTKEAVSINTASESGD